MVVSIRQAMELKMTKRNMYVLKSSVAITVLMSAIVGCRPHYYESKPPTFPKLTAPTFNFEFPKDNDQSMNIKFQETWNNIYIENAKQLPKSEIFSVRAGDILTSEADANLLVPATEDNFKLFHLENSPTNDLKCLLKSGSQFKILGFYRAENLEKLNSYVEFPVFKILKYSTGTCPADTIILGNQATEYQNLGIIAPESFEVTYAR
jgi:hypothetical protein